jgi:hypothetical protein
MTKATAARAASAKAPERNDGPEPDHENVPATCQLRARYVAGTRGPKGSRSDSDATFFVSLAASPYPVAISPSRGI